MCEPTVPLRVIRARWCLLAAAQPVLAASGAPLPFRVSADGGDRGVARYDASSTAGATLAWFGPDRAVLSCGDLGWRVPGSAGPVERVDEGPSWLTHVTALDHRVSAGRYGWCGTWEDGLFTASDEPLQGAPLPPVGDADRMVAALGAGRGDTAGLHHLVRMCEYEWLDAASWWAALGGAASDRMMDESWLRLREAGLTQWTGEGPVVDGVPGLTPEQARIAATEFARERGLWIPDEVRVEAALRTGTGWQVGFLDYRDAETARPLVISIPDAGPARIEEGWGVRRPGRRPD